MNKFNDLKNQGFTFSFCFGGFHISIPAFSKQILNENSEINNSEFSLWQYYTDAEDKDGMYADNHVHMPFGLCDDRIEWNADILESYITNLIKFKEMVKCPPFLTKQEAINIRENTLS